MKTCLRSLGSIAALISFLSSPAFSQAPSALWSHTAGVTATEGPLHNMASAMAKDEEGYVYLTGTLQGSTAFGSTVLQVEGLQNAFIAKYTPQGTLAWVKGITGPGLVEKLSIAVNATSVYVTGQFRGELNFNAGRSTPVTLTGPNELSAAGSSVSGFVAKFNAETADLDWVTPFLGTQFGDGVYNLQATTAHGELFVSGAFLGEIDFDSNGSSLLKSSAGNADGFLMKINPNGTTAWWRGVGGVNGDAISAVATNDQGLFVGGFFVGEADFNRGGLQPEVNASLGGNRNVFLARFHPGTGEFDWLTQTQGAFSLSYVNALVLHSSGIYMAGWFSTNFAWAFNIKFPAAGNDFWRLGCKGENDAFIAKFGYNDGNVSWAKAIGGAGHDYVYGLAVDDEGVYATGYFDASTDVNIKAVLESNPSGIQAPVIKDIVGERDVLLVKYSHSNGDLLWSKAIANGQDQVGAAVAADPSGVYVAGGFEGELDFNPEGATPMMKTSQSSMDVFLVKYANTLTGADEDPITERLLRVFPNPASNHLTIEASLDWKGNQCQVKVLNMWGIMVWQQPVQLSDGGRVDISLEHLPAGNYVVLLQNETSMATKKLVKL